MLVLTDIAFFTTFLVNVCTFRFQAKIGWQVVSGLSYMFAGIPFLSGVKPESSYFLHYRPVLLILATVIILFCDTYRLVLTKTHTKQVEQSINTDVYVYCVVMAILSDFHTRPTNMFRLFVAFLMVTLTGVSVTITYLLCLILDSLQLVIGMITMRFSFC